MVGGSECVGVDFGEFDLIRDLMTNKEKNNKKKRSLEPRADAFSRLKISNLHVFYFSAVFNWEIITKSLSLLKY